MWIGEKVTCVVEARMTGSESVDEWSFDESKEIIEALARFIAVMGEKDKIKAIKFLRNNYNCGLRFGKAFTEESVRLYNAD